MQPAQPRKSKVWVVVGLTVSVFVILLIAGVVLYFVAQSFVTANEAETDAEGRSPASYFKPGDCIKELPKTAQNVTVVDCEKAHTAEVIAVFMIPDGDFPGDAAIDEYKSRCEPELAAYAPTAADDPSVQVLKRFPDEQSWGIGDRSVTCIAAFDTPQTGSLKG